MSVKPIDELKYLFLELDHRHEVKNDDDAHYWTLRIKKWLQQNGINI